ncbi:MAG: type II secretion system F family protein [Phycisphaerae bacterium]|nr:type II secretion system F family protein [Phycisphaerae bacterium]
MGLILLPFAMAGMILSAIDFDRGAIAGITDEAFWIVVMAIGLFCAAIVLVRLVPTAGHLETPWYKSFAIIVIILFKYLILLALLTAVFHILGIVLFILVVVGIVRYKLTCRYTLALDVLSAVRMSMRQSLPLPMVLNAAAQGQKKRRSRIFRDIAEWLTQGWTLSEALTRGYPKCPPELLAAVRCGEKMNQLPNAIETILADITERVDNYRRVRPVHPWYPLLVMIAAVFFVLGLAVFIIPQFAQLLEDLSDHQTALPAVTQILFQIVQFIMGPRGFNAAVIAAVILLIVLRCVFSSIYRRRSGRLSLTNRLSDWFKWHLPVIHWFEKTRAHLQLIEMLKVGLQAGWPVNTVIQNALDLDMNWCFRKRLEQWLSRVEEGQNIAKSAQQCGFDKALIWSFDESINKGNTPQILDALEHLYRSRYHYRINLMNAVCCPLIIVGLGCFVGFVIAGMYLPMVKIIEMFL